MSRIAVFAGEASLHVDQWNALQHGEKIVSDNSISSCPARIPGETSQRTLLIAADRTDSRASGLQGACRPFEGRRGVGDTTCQWPG
ncbi:hypothetical protein ASZ90_010002 [hydrocarbon metagenome]|uniref:Uncharacterized protein n=1 Tax=hydrocarbon metagenome TaxID=938273 RepID=A0A0W8FH90_9ZZZZ